MRSAMLLGVELPINGDSRACSACCLLYTAHAAYRAPHRLVLRTCPTTSRGSRHADTMSTEKHLYAIHCLDDQSCGRAEGEPRGGSAKRMGNYPAHKEYQVATSTPDDPRFINKISAGPMVDEDDKYMIGSFFLVASTREEAQAFVDNDPFKKEGIWETIKVERYVSVVGVKPHSGNL